MFIFWLNHITRCGRDLARVNGAGRRWQLVYISWFSLSRCIWQPTDTHRSTHSTPILGEAVQWIRQPECCYYTYKWIIMCTHTTHTQSYNKPLRIWQLLYNSMGSPRVRSLSADTQWLLSRAFTYSTSWYGTTDWQRVLVVSKWLQLVTKD